LSYVCLVGRNFNSCPNIIVFGAGVKTGGRPNKVSKG